MFAHSNKILDLVLNGGWIILAMAQPITETRKIFQIAAGVCKDANVSLVTVCNHTAFAYPSGCPSNQPSTECMSPVPGYNCTAHSLANVSNFTCLSRISCPPFSDPSGRSTPTPSTPIAIGHSVSITCIAGYARKDGQGFTSSVSCTPYGFQGPTYSALLADAACVPISCGAYCRSCPANTPTGETTDTYGPCCTTAAEAFSTGFSAAYGSVEGPAATAARFNATVLISCSPGYDVVPGSGRIAPRCLARKSCEYSGGRWSPGCGLRRGMFETGATCGPSVAPVEFSVAGDFSLDGGLCNAATDVCLLAGPNMSISLFTQTAGATIYYRIARGRPVAGSVKSAVTPATPERASTPTDGAERYTGPIIFSARTVGCTAETFAARIRAVAVRGGMPNSPDRELGPLFKVMSTLGSWPPNSGANVVGRCQDKAPSAVYSCSNPIYLSEESCLRIPSQGNQWLPQAPKSALGGCLSYRYVAFIPLALAGSAPDAVSLAALRFFYSGEQITAGTARSNGIYPAAERPQNLFGFAGRRSKWLQLDNCPVYFDFGRPMAMDSYNLKTSYDCRARDPVRWQLLASPDFVNWVMIDDRSKDYFDLPEARAADSEMIVLKDLISTPVIATYRRISITESTKVPGAMNRLTVEVFIAGGLVPKVGTVIILTGLFAFVAPPSQTATAAAAAATEAAAAAAATPSSEGAAAAVAAAAAAAAAATEDSRAPPARIPLRSSSVCIGNDCYTLLDDEADVTYDDDTLSVMTVSGKLVQCPQPATAGDECGRSPSCTRFTFELVNPSIPGAGCRPAVILAGSTNASAVQLDNEVGGARDTAATVVVEAIESNTVAGGRNEVTVTTEFNFRPMAGTALTLSGLRDSLSHSDPRMEVQWILEDDRLIPGRGAWNRTAGTLTAILPADSQPKCDDSGKCSAGHKVKLLLRLVNPTGPPAVAQRRVVFVSAAACLVPNCISLAAASAAAAADPDRPPPPRTIAIILPPAQAVGSVFSAALPCEIVLDACGECGGNGTLCLGCDGVPNSRKEVDRCGVCGGVNSCVGCDGVVGSGVTIDTCGVCGGTDACRVTPMSAPNPLGYWPHVLFNLSVTGLRGPAAAFAANDLTAVTAAIAEQLTVARAAVIVLAVTDVVAVQSRSLTATPSSNTGSDGTVSLMDIVGSLMPSDLLGWLGGSVWAARLRVAGYPGGVEHKSRFARSEEILAVNFDSGSDNARRGARESRHVCDAARAAWSGCLIRSDPESEMPIRDDSGNTVKGLRTEGGSVSSWTLRFDLGVNFVRNSDATTAVERIKSSVVNGTLAAGLSSRDLCVISTRLSCQVSLLGDPVAVLINATIPSPQSPLNGASDLTALIVSVCVAGVVTLIVGSVLFFMWCRVIRRREAMGLEVRMSELMAAAERGKTVLGTEIAL